MNEILAAVIPVVIIGVICAGVLVIASKLMAVKEDERFPAVRDCLPGANCGACGFAGCDGYAKALCEDPSTPANLCIPGAASVANQLAGVLGVEVGDVVEQVAVVHCSGDCQHTQDKVAYSGIETCAAAAKKHVRRTRFLSGTAWRRSTPATVSAAASASRPAPTT